MYFFEVMFWYPTNWVKFEGTCQTRFLKCVTTVYLSGVSIRSRWARKNGADPPGTSGRRFCSTVNLTSSAVIWPKPSWNCTPERSLNVHVLSSFDGFHSVATPGTYANVFGSRIISGSCILSHSVLSDWLIYRESGVAVTHWRTATTRRPPDPPPTG